MATGGLDLGDVGFSLTADTDGLDRALKVLRDFGEAVNRYERRTDETSQKVTTAYMRQEKAMVSLYQKMTNLQEQARRLGAPEIVNEKSTQALQQYIYKLTEASKTGQPIVRSMLEMQRATAAASSEYLRASNALKDWQVESRRAAKVQEELQRQIALTNKGRIQQAIAAATPLSGKSAKDSASVFMSAGLMPDTALANANAHILAYQKEQAALRQLTESYNANANGHVQAFQRHQVIQRQRIEAANKGVDAHVQAYRKEQAALEKLNRTVRESADVALVRARSRANTLTAGATRVFAPPEITAQYGQALAAFEARLKSTTLTSKGLSIAQTELGASYARITQKVRDYTASQNAANQAEMLAARATQRVRRVNEAALSFNAPRGVIDTNTANLKNYQSALFSGDRRGADQALQSLNAGLLRTQTILAGSTDKAQKFSTALRGMERATILAVGPLSGLGARMAVLAALFESTTVKAAMGIAGFTALTAAIWSLASAGVRAKMVFDQFNSGLIAASGSPALVADEMEYLIATSMKYGQSVRSLTPSYISFGTSARLANVALKEQRDIFESFTIAGAALHWTAEQSSRAFLALEQMMSKGQVQTQEMKLQLGQVLPGAMELAAMSIGKTTAQFMKMMEQGEVFTKDFMPKFAAKVREVYNEASKYGAQALQADIGRFDTNKLFAAKAIDDAIKASVAFQGALRSVNQMLQWLGENADKAIAGFLAGIAAIVSLYIPALLMGLGKVLTMVRSLLMIGTAFSMVAGGWVAVLLRVGGMALAGAGAYKVMNDLMKDQTDKVQEIINQQAVALAGYEQGIVLTGRLKEEHIAQLQLALEMAQQRRKEMLGELEIGIAQVQSVNLLTKAYENAAKAASVLWSLGKPFKPVWDLIIPTKTPDMSNATAIKEQSDLVAKLQLQQKQKEQGGIAAWFLPGLDELNQKLTVARNQLEAMRKFLPKDKPKGSSPEVDALDAQIINLQKMLDKYGELETAAEAHGETGDEAGKKLQGQYESVYKTISKLVNEFEFLKQAQGAAAQGDKVQLDLLEAKKKVDDFFDGMNRKTRDQFVAKLEREFSGIFQTLGIQGDTFEAKLANLHLEIDKGSAAVQRYNDAWKDLPKAKEGIRELQRELQSQLGEMQAGEKGQDALSDYKAMLDQQKIVQEAMSKVWDNEILLNTDNIAQTAEEWDKVYAVLQKIFAIQDRNREVGNIENTFGNAEAILKSKREELDILVNLGLKTEIEARTQLREAYKQQGDTLASSLIPRIEKMMKELQDPAAVANLQLILAKLKQMQDLGRIKTPMEGLQRALDDYVASAGNAFEVTRDSVKDMLETMEDALTEFIKTGKMDFKSLADSMIDDIARVLAKAAMNDIIAMLTGQRNGSGLMDFFGSSFGGSSGGGGGFDLLGSLGGLLGIGGGSAPAWDTGIDFSSAANVFDMMDFGDIDAFSTMFANGGIMTGKGPQSLPLNTYSNGGVADTPQLAYFAEMRKPEAYVPLPDGRTIPVTMKGGGGGGDNINITVNVSGTHAPDIRRAAAQGAREALGYINGAKRYA